MYTSHPTIAIDPVAFVDTECNAVSSLMRQHPRWAHSSITAILGGGGGPSKPPPLNLENRSRRSTPLLVEEDASGSWRLGSRRARGKSLHDNPLISGFTKLRSELRGCRDIKTFDTPALLYPFLQVIKSSATSAAITALALRAVRKFLSYSVISRDSPRLPQAMQLLSAAITHCRFEASGTSADDVVYTRILRLMEEIISGPCGDILSDESVCQIMETGLGLCCDPRFTQMLQRSAEISMVNMCQVVFERLKHLEIEAGDEPGALEEETKDDMDTVKMETSVNGAVGLDDNSTLAPQSFSHSNGERTSIGGGEMEKSQELVPERLHQEDLNASSMDLTEGGVVEEPPIKPYSLPSIKELLRSLVGLLDPVDRNYTDSMRIMALRIVDVALEVAGPSIANHPSLASLAKDTLCRHLFQLVRSDNMGILNESLRVAGTLLATCRSVLKLQQELFLSYLVTCLFPRMDIPQEPGIDPRLYEGVPQAPSLIKQTPSQQSSSSGRSTPVPLKERQKLGLEGGTRKPDAREAMVESIGALVRMPSFMAELFVNYDCDIDRNDLCADMVGLLSRNAFPDAATWSTTNVPPLCLDALLGFVQSIAERLDDEPVTEGLPLADDLNNQRRLKSVIIKGSAKFNENPKAGLAYLVSQGVIRNIDDPDQIAQFLIGTSRLDKKVLGEFISKGSNGSILHAFISQFDFAGKAVEESLRELLYTFRLPGESQLIERIMTEFSQKYLADGNHDNVGDADSVFVLTYAVIMLNTDQHNKNLKGAKRMAVEDFGKNLRGTNAGKDYEPEYLQSIFTSIKTREIILPEEHGNTKHAYDHAWKELMQKIRTASNLTICKTNIYDADMFAATWKPIIATLSYVFINASEDAVFSRVFAGFAQCAQIAARHGFSDALDQIIFSLSSISTLATGTLPNTSLNTEVMANEKSVMVSETAVRFGRDDRAQQATVVLFRVLEGNEASVRDGWEHVVRIMLNLFINSLIPPSLSSSSKTLEFPPIPLQPPVQVIDRGAQQNEGGLFSAFSSYVSSFTNDEPPEPSEQEIENTLCAVDCINQCSFPDLVERLSALPIDSLRSLINTLLAQIPEDSSPRVITVKSEVQSPTTPRASGRRTRVNAPVYDPTLVFVLEFATLLALRDDETVAELGKDVASALQSVLRNAANVHFVTISRVVYYLLILLRSSNDYDFLRAPVILHAFAAFDQDTLQHCALPLTKGISECITASTALRKEMATSPDFWDILTKLHALSEVSPHVFNILSELNKSPQMAITADNYVNTITLLNAFATAASVGAGDEQRRDMALRKGGKGAKMPRQKHKEEVKRGVDAMLMVYGMTSRIPAFISQSHLEPTKAWEAYWSPIFTTLTTQCTNPCREIRQQAFGALRQSLLDKNLLSSSQRPSSQRPSSGDDGVEGGGEEVMAEQWQLDAIFDKVLFPLVRQLLKPDVYATDVVGMSETRVLASQLLCRIFLHYLSALWEGGRMGDLWGVLLEVMDRLKNSGQGDTLEEAVTENVKNILLVMSSGGYLVPPGKDTTEEQDNLWLDTWKRLDRFLPNLLQELFPEEAEKPRRTSKEKGGEQVEKSVELPVREGREEENEEKAGESKRASVEDDDDDEVD
ncbi:hypothetical protein EJ08DRAFT_662157 [Tothia fuscella]|uniref:SEC7 domain-containing protein n=1 Tax=Tothia fuscella TaxID=1048955 RepID=A0A9P4TWX9_9PEZI|nr:hypothetical protein EJ08DRAFT_662157 [Tothia fuscella]